MAWFSRKPKIEVALCPTPAQSDVARVHLALLDYCKAAKGADRERAEKLFMDYARMSLGAAPLPPPTSDTPRAPRAAAPEYDHGVEAAIRAARAANDLPPLPPEWRLGDPLPEPAPDSGQIGSIDNDWEAGVALASLRERERNGRGAAAADAGVPPDEAS